jgi:uncharacterized protein YycO
MSFLQPVQCSRTWYDFVAQTAIKDEEVQRLAQDYIAAMNKLNARLVELSNGHPTLKSLSLGSSSGNGGVASDFVESVQQFHEFHGASYSEAEIIADAQRHGVVTISVNA